MRNIPPELFNQFYEPLVGTETNILTFQSQLSQRVNSYPGNFTDTDPYARLGQGFTDIIGQKLSRLVRESSYRIEDEEIGNLSSLLVNGTIGGQVTVAALRSVGKAYHQRVTVAQTQWNVSKSTNNILGQAFGIACADQYTAAYNLEAFYRGVSPKSRLLCPLVRLGVFINPQRPVRFHQRMLAVEADERAQLAIRPRYERLRGKDPQRRCPATRSKVEIAGQQSAALFTVMRAMGEVAITDIFPHYFTIIPDVEA